MCSKHVEIWNKYIGKRIVRQVGCLQELNRDARSTKHKKIGLLFGYLTKDLIIIQELVCSNLKPLIH